MKESVSLGRESVKGKKHKELQSGWWVSSILTSSWTNDVIFTFVALYRVPFCFKSNSYFFSCHSCVSRSVHINDIPTDNDQVCPDGMNRLAHTAVNVLHTLLDSFTELICNSRKTLFSVSRKWIWNHKKMQTFPFSITVLNETPKLAVPLEHYCLPPPRDNGSCGFSGLHI